MTKKKKTDRKAAKRFLSVVPVTTRERTGTKARQPNLRALMMIRIKQIEGTRQRLAAENERLCAAIKALGSKKALR